MSVKNLPKLKVSMKYKRFSDPVLYSFAKGTVFTGDPDATNPPESDNDVYTFADDFMATLTNRQTSPSPAVTALKNSQRIILLDALDNNAGYLEMIANKVAKASGDADKGRTVVTRVGYQLAGRGSYNRLVGFVDVGIGWAHVHENKSKQGNESHNWEAGFTTSKGVPPSITYIWNSLEADGIFINIPSGTVFAYRHASIVPVSHSTKTGVKAESHSAASKTSTILPMSKGKHPVFDFNHPNNYQFGEWHYVIIP
jgi:hypothetical protein